MPNLIYTTFYLNFKAYIFAIFNPRALKGENSCTSNNKYSQQNYLTWIYFRLKLQNNVYRLGDSLQLIFM